MTNGPNHFVFGSGIRDTLHELHRLTDATTSYADLHGDQARAAADDDTEEDWFWVAVTARRLTARLDDLELHLAKLGIIDPQHDNQNLE